MALLFRSLWHRFAPAPLFVLAGLGFGCSGSDDEAGPPPEKLPELVEGPLIRYVDPFIGTGGIGFGVGSAYPGPAMPFGMIHPGPDTATNGADHNLTHFSGYFYGDSEISGFSHMRLQGTGAVDLGNILVMPTTGFQPDMAVGEGYRSSYSHDTETASPGYYAVTLERYGIRVELTSGYRAALHRYTYPDGTAPTILFDPTHFAGMSGKVVAASARLESGRVLGHVHYSGSLSGRDGGVQFFYVAELDRPVLETQAWADGLPSTAASFQGTNGGIALRLDGGAGIVHLKIAISAIDEQKALENLAEEAPAFDFDAMQRRAEEAWEKVLSRIRIAGGTEDQRAMFYSSLYRAYLMPTLFSEVGGAYRGLDKQVHTAQGFSYYTDFSLWDTFRSLHPLINLIDPEKARDFAASLSAMIKEGGAVPRWPLGTNYTGTMIGSSADIVIAETYLKGITDFDVEAAYQGMRRQALEPKPAGQRGDWRDDIDQYVALGYVARDASVTLEYAYNDWALGNLAKALGKSDDAKLFSDRAKNWKNLWDTETQFIRPKDELGAFLAQNPFTHGGPFTEGNAWQWSFYVPHDGRAVIEAFGSADAFVEKLDILFDKSSTLKWDESGQHHLLPDIYYWHSNEVCIHSAYLFNDAGRWDLAQKWAKTALDTQYRKGPDGLPGNDDGGTMSAWYVLSALGFYPIAGGDEYWLGRPIFPRAVLVREAGDIEIRAAGAEQAETTFGTAKVAGQKLTGRFNHALIARGAKLEFLP